MHKSNAVRLELARSELARSIRRAAAERYLRAAAVRLSPGELALLAREPANDVRAEVNRHA